MKRLVMATNNAHKLEEMRAIAGNEIEILSLSDIGCCVEIPETCDTIEGNAVQKARFIKEKFGYDCFADDTGLEVEALGGAPGVYSARYAGEGCTPADNVRLLLKNLEGKDNRRARFRTCIALVEGDEVTLSEGCVEGVITAEGRGAEGFGYDPVFMPDGYEQTYAEMTAATKNSMSHRALAAENFIKTLKAKSVDNQ